MARLPTKINGRILCKSCDTNFFTDIQRTAPVEPIGARIRLFSVEYATCPNGSELNLKVVGDATGIGLMWEPLASYPTGALDTQKIPAPIEVPVEIAKDYNEAISVLSISPKSSATLSRRCLQSMLIEKGYNQKNLVDQINSVINEADIEKVVPAVLRQTLHVVRRFGNFGAHPMKENENTQIIDVEPGEAEWCLEILRNCFDVFYVEPKKLAARMADLEDKLQSSRKLRGDDLNPKQ